ncbi:MAG TPA: M20/M25/M40 family metallo-hydrolase [Planctomycetota bacterium]|nr:M20/M25/M40 family metallo-hydrolase [Planctomycetota bacterium]
MIVLPAHAELIGQTVIDLCAIKSLSGEEAPVANYVQKFLSSAGLSSQRDEQDNVYCVIEPAQPGDPLTNTLHLSGHMDTVVPVEGWQSDPWHPQLAGEGDDRRIVALGTSDMKSGLAVMLHLASHFARPENRPKNLRLVVSFTICEESPAHGKINGVHRILKKQPGRWAITTEASCDHICPTIALGCQAHAVARVSLTGRSAHSASPEKGLSAIHAAGIICQRVDQLNRSFKDIHILGEVYARAAAAVTLIKGGSAANIIPEHCELTISRRVAPGETIKDVENDIAALTQNIGEVKAAWTLRCDAPACVTDTQGPLLRAASEASGILFKQVRYSWNRARTDMVLFRQAGMDILNIGPGYAGQAHVAGEYVRLIDLPRSANLLGETILRLDQWLAANA